MTWTIHQSQRTPDWLVLIGPYSDDFLADFKASISPMDREWFPVLKAWKIRAERRPALEALVKRWTT